MFYTIALILLLLLIIIIVLSIQDISLGLPQEFLPFYAFMHSNFAIISISVIFIIVFLFIIDYYNLNFALDGKTRVEKVYDVERKEGFLSTRFLEPKFKHGFCNVYENKSLSELDEECQKLSTDNCLETNCCGVINKKLCVAGWHTGPAFTVDNYKDQLKGDSIMHYLDNYDWQHRKKEEEANNNIEMAEPNKTFPDPMEILNKMLANMRK